MTRNIRWRAGIGVALALCAVLAHPSSAYACITWHIPGPRDLARSPIVVRAIVRSYHPIIFPDRGRNKREWYREKRVVDAAEFHFEVVETLAGAPQPSSWTAIWAMRNHYLPVEWHGPFEVIVGLDVGNSPPGQNRVVVDQDPNCGPAKMMEDTPATVGLVKDALEKAQAIGLRGSPGILFLGDDNPVSSVTAIPQPR